VAPVAERVHVLGELPREQALALVSRADVVVLPSLWENLANACLEAMALGRPVVATSVGGFVELLEHGETGSLVPPGDADGLAAELSRLLGDEEARRALGARAAERAAELDVPRIAERLVDLYERVAADGTAFDERIYRRGYRRYFHPENRRDPFRRLYAAKRSYVLARFEEHERLRVLDVGGGYGRFAGPLSKRHEVTLLDVSPEMLAEARQRHPGLRVVQGDARALPFPDESFDAVLAFDLLPHLPDLEEALRELRRVARPGGEVVFDTTNASPWWVPLYPRYVNWRPKRLVQTMRAGGILPEWRQLVRHHRAGEVRRALETVGLRPLAMRGFGPRFARKWHLWWTVRPD
jgi:glycogen(starch) synthase